MATKNTGVQNTADRLHSLSTQQSGSFGVVETAAVISVAPKAVPLDQGDPTGVKAYVAFSVAHGIYPNGAGINPDEDIASDAKLNAATIALEINFDAGHLAIMHHLVWNAVKAGDVTTLEKVSGLVSLVKAHLSDGANAAGNKQ